MTFIVGISGYFHDSSVCLVQNGKIIEFLKEEDFTRIKGSNGFPYRALTFLKMRYDLSDQNIGAIVFYEKPLRGWAKRVHHSLKSPIKSFSLLSHQLKQFWNGPINFASELRKLINLKEKKIFYSPHHLSHALSAISFIPKSLLNMKILHFVFDGVGDDDCHSVFLTSGTLISKIFDEKYPNSIGLFYSTITDFCGFLVNEGEYKLMALSAFGKPVFKDIMLKEILCADGHRISMDMSWFDLDKTPERSFSKKFINHFGKPIKISNINSPSDVEFIRAANLAKSAQSAVEEVLTQVIKWATNHNPHDAITISGGVAQNSLAMQRMAKIPSLKNKTIIIPPSPGDSGAAIGAAAFGNLRLSNSFVQSDKIFYGSGYTKNDTELFNNLFKKIKTSERMDSDVDNLLLSGEIICTFFDGKEIGPRALGNRSILCAANSKETVTNLNRKIKKREFFRPLAPVMLMETATRHFYLDKNVLINYRWMALTARAKNSIPKQYLPVLHKDGTARIQIIDDKTHYISIILQRLAGRVDMLINTSFNVAGDPIVHDIIDCYTNMKRLGVSYLISDSGLYKLKNNKQANL